MALTTFHLFSRLPPELRAMIWDAAVRPNLPSAHFFTAWNGEKNRPYTADYSTLANHSVAGRGRQPDVPCGLAAPCRNGQEPNTPSWFCNNPSAYLIDSGLWTACRESRRAMIKRFGNHKVTYRKETIAQMAVEPPPEFNDAPATGTMIQDGKRQYFTVCPKTDLFCLQPFNKNFPLIWWEFESDVPIFNIRGSPRVHIALEFDPHWTGRPGEVLSMGLHSARYEIELHGQSRTELGCVFWAAASQQSGYNWAKKLWFIDYRISWNHNFGPLNYDGDHRMVFYGRGCKFVEVNENNPAWVMGHERPDESIHNFLRVLRELLRIQAAHYTTNAWIAVQSGHPANYNFPYLQSPKIGILACIEDD